MSQRTAKLFMNGRSQAVRLPKEFRFEGKEVYVHREGDQVILSPAASPAQDLTDVAMSSFSHTHKEKQN